MKKLIALFVVMLIGVAANAQAAQAAKGILIRSINKIDSLAVVARGGVDKAFEAGDKGIEKGKQLADTIAVRGQNVKKGLENAEERGKKVGQKMKESGEKIKDKGSEIKEGLKEFGKKAKEDVKAAADTLGIKSHARKVSKKD